MGVNGIEDDGTAANGIGLCVMAVRNHKTLGNYAVIHVNDTRIWPNGYFVMLAHMQSDLKVVRGIGVANNALVGRMSSTGRSTGVHCHYGLYPAIRPYEFDRHESWITFIDFYNPDKYHGSVDPMLYTAQHGEQAPKPQPKPKPKSVVSAVKTVGSGAVYHYASLAKKWIALLPIIATVLGLNPEIVQTAQTIVEKAPQIIALIETLETGEYIAPQPTPMPIDPHQPAELKRWWTEAGVYLRTEPSIVSTPIEYAERQTNSAAVIQTGPSMVNPQDGYTWVPVQIESTGESGYMAARYLTLR